MQGNKYPFKKDLPLREEDGEIILYNKPKKTFCTLNKTATAIWNLCDGKRNVKDIAKSIFDEYDIILDEALAEVEKTLQTFTELEIICFQ